MKRTATSNNEEPEQKSFEKPSEKEHLFQIVEVFDMDNNPYKLDLGPDDTASKCEVVGGDEEGRSLLNRASLDDQWKGFFATRLFLKAIGCEYKGDNFPIDSDLWTGRQFYATIIHNESKGKMYANIKEYNFDKMVDNSRAPVAVSEPSAIPDEIAWDDK